MATFRLSNHCLGILNFITFLLSILVLASGVWLSHNAHTACESFLDKPLIVIGTFLMLVSIAGFVGACFRVSWLLWVYLVATLLLIVLGICFTIFAFAVTSRGSGGVSIPGKAYKEYRLGDYSYWLQKRVSKSKNWKRIRSCLVETKVCFDFQKQYLGYTADRFYQQKFSSVESGCCKPSNDCNFTYIGPTNWNETNGVYDNRDCNTWDNDPRVLCLDCQSCKAGVVDKLGRQWRKVAIIDIFALIFLIVVYIMGCYASKNNQEDKGSNA